MIEENLKSQAADIFIRAAAYIRQYGWQLEGMGDHGRPRCSMGALASANPAIEWDKRLARLMYHALYRELNGLSLTQFNSRYRNGEKVARLFERAAGQLNNKSQPLYV